MHSFLRSSLALLIALTPCGFAQETPEAKPSHFTVGGVRMEIPAPEGFIALPKAEFGKFYEMVQSSQPVGNIVQVLFFPSDELAEIQSGTRSASRHAMVYTMSKSKDNCSLDDFDKAVKPEIRNLGAGKSDKVVKAAISDVSKKAEKLTGEQLDFDGFQPVHDESGRHIACSLSMSQPSDSGKTCGTVSLILAKARAICVATYENGVTDRKEGIDASRKAAKDWTKQILLANPPPVELQSAESKSYESKPYMIGKLAGSLLGFILIVGVVVKLVIKVCKK